jgi:hypothetical protein
MRATTMATMMAASQRSQGRGRFSAIQALFHCEGERERERGERASREHRLRCHEPGPAFTLRQRFRRQGEDRGKKQRQSGERQRPIEPGDPIVKRDQHGERNEHAGGAPQHRRERAR